MTELLKMLMTAVFDIAVFFLVICSARGKMQNAEMRFTALTFAVGFLTEIFEECITGSSYAAAILAALGFMLSYMLFVFNISEKRKRFEKH